MSVQEDFKRILNEINTIKPPGVSGSRIKTLKENFLNNSDPTVEEELTQILITACKTTINSNKLGVLYVLDAIVRALIDSQRGEASILKIQSIIPDLIDESLLIANDDLKDKIGKLIDIWDQCNSFDKEMIIKIKDKHFKSHTPPGSPPLKSSKLDQQPSSNAVLNALANLASKKSPTPSTPTINSSSAASATTSNESNPNAIFQLLQTMNKASPAASNNASINNNRERERERPNRRDRDRSPQRTQQSQPKPTHIDGEQNNPSNPHFRPKRPYVDNEIPSGSIGVLSRTIFIGGVPSSMSERELTSTLRPYAEVQSVILNNERKHAFVKVYSRAEAEQVIQALSSNHPSGLRARWGVGFGPRDCCNYQTGISTIPLHRLTDADRKWLMCAQWGGSIPDLPIQSGLFVEEPDIEVGTGVSSKSISRKMPTNTNPNGPKSDANNSATDGSPYQQHQQHQQQIPQQQPPQQYYQAPGYPQAAPPIQNQYYPPQQQQPQQPQPMPMNGMSQAQMMTMMSQMMAQQQQQGGSNGVDMAQMFQTMANMMQQQQQPPPQ